MTNVFNSALTKTVVYAIRSRDFVAPFRQRW